MKQSANIRHKEGAKYISGINGNRRNMEPRKDDKNSINQKNKPVRFGKPIIIPIGKTTTLSITYK